MTNNYNNANHSYTLRKYNVINDDSRLSYLKKKTNCNPNNSKDKDKDKDNDSRKPVKTNREFVKKPPKSMSLNQSFSEVDLNMSIKLNADNKPILTKTKESKHSNDSIQI